MNADKHGLEFGLLGYIMADDKTTIKELIDCIAQFESERDWRQFHSPKNLSMGIAIETGELLELFQWITTHQSHQVVDDPEQMDRIREEMADIFCYLLNLAHVLNIDLSEAFFEKVKRNAQKYPADKYRGKYKL
jgi:NTP pyrophosphatase (non-canonical NTP hydrolase)